MIVERIELERLRSLDGINTLNTLEVGDSVFLSDFKKSPKHARTFVLLGKVAQAALEIYLSQDGPGLACDQGGLSLKYP